MSHAIHPSSVALQASSDVTIVIPTFRRPDLLRKCVTSCLAQKRVETVSADILIIDNSPEASAEPMACEMARHAAWPIRYIHEPQPGISNSRNAGLQHAIGNLLAFIDDDEVAAEDWLANLLQTQRVSQADVVFGPVFPSIPSEVADNKRSLVRDLLTHTTQKPTGTEVSSTLLVPFWARGDKAYPNLASGNFLLRRHSDKAKDLRFEPKLGRTGGEDTLYFNQLLIRGGRFVWCGEAIAWEHVPPERLSLKYALMRAFRGGQMVSMTPILLMPKRPAMTILSMTIASVQIPFYAALTSFGVLMRSPRWPHHLIRMAGAAGKLLWIPPFRAQSYGAKIKKPSSV